jgi:hypothetical protein
MPRRDHPGVAPARAGGDIVALLEKHDLVAVPLKLISGGDADNAASEHHDAHKASGKKPIRR